MKKRVFVVALVICLVAMVGFGTLAYFKSSKNLTNYFAVAGIKDPTDPNETINPDNLFSIKLEETDIKGQSENDKTESGNIYTGILPGDVLHKDPTVTNTGMYDAWVRVKVEVTDYEAWVNACGKHGIEDLADIFGGHDSNAWEQGQIEFDYDTATDTATYVYYYKEKLAPGESATLFKTLAIPASFDVTDMASLSTFQIKITGEAIQVANTSDDSAKDAFRGFWD